MMRESLAGILFCSFLFCSQTFAAPIASSDSVKKQNSTDRYENIGLFQKVLFFIEQNYVEEVKNKDLIYGAIKGMMETLDPHSNFLPPEVFREMKVDTAGRFGGVGIEVGVKDSVLTVISPIEDTPAFKAGIKPGDKILKINGESTKGMSIMDAVSKMRGKNGSEVLVQIWREGFKKPKDLRVKRAEIKIAGVKSEPVEPGYLYLRLTSFNENSSKDLKKALLDFEKKSSSEKTMGVVLDLRNNPGGLLDQAVEVASLFVDEGVIVSTKGRNKESEEIRYAKKGEARKDFRVAVLVNGASASASEIVAGALQDLKRAVVMGQPTFGKGSVQSVVEITPEIGLKLTVARYYTPNGRSIQLKGIQPDILLEDYDTKVLQAALKQTSSIREKDLKHHMKGAVRGVEEKDDKEFSPEEYKLTAKEESESEKNQKAEESSPLVFDAKPEAKPEAKNDYQVREAVKYMKSYEMFRSAEAPRSMNQ